MARIYSTIHKFTRQLKELVYLTAEDLVEKEDD